MFLSQNELIELRKELVWHPMTYFRSAPKSVPFTVSTTQKGIPLILASVSFLGYNLSNESYYLLH